MMNIQMNNCEKAISFSTTMIVIISIVSLCSCKKYLDLKPNSSLYIPSNLKDCQAILDNYSDMNGNYPSAGEAAADDFFLTDANWTSLTEVEAQTAYTWDPHALVKTTQWQNSYKVVFNANTVLELLKKIDPGSGADYNVIKGSALFFRAYAFYNIASLFCKPYDPSSSGQDPGTPIRLSPDVELKDERGTVQQTYDRIITDLKEALELLPESSSIKSRPNKIAALSALARVYLAMRDYTNAGAYADACLNKYSTLMQFKSLNAAAPFPFTRFNPEVIFHATMSGPVSLSQTNAKVIKLLYDSYSSNDIRKEAFFRTNTGVNIGTYAFKGSYDGSIGLFSGLTTGEVYLIRAECYARAGKTSEALKDLNNLMITRFKVVKDANGNVVKDINGNDISTYTPYTTTNADVALGFILTERRKELFFRGLRWTDLRRLNKESRFAITLSRTVNGTTYTLPPNDSRYALLIPQDVINNSTIAQNPR